MQIGGFSSDIERAKVRAIRRDCCLRRSPYILVIKSVPLIKHRAFARYIVSLIKGHSPWRRFFSPSPLHRSLAVSYTLLLFRFLNVGPSLKKVSTSAV